MRFQPVSAMVRFNDSTEAWLSAGSTFFAFGSAGLSREDYRAAYESYEAKRLELNAAFRNANAHLVDACRLEPLELYTNEGTAW